MYPHQVLMEEHSLQKQDLSKEAQNYLKDFNHFHRGVSLKKSRAEKKGVEFAMTEADNDKLNRFSKSVCIQIYEDMNTTRQEAEKKKAEELKIQEEALQLKKAQEEEDAKRKSEAEEKKKEEEKRLELEKLAQAEQQERELAEKAQAEAQEKAKAKAKAEEGGGLFDYFF
tara:strand:- start:3456 stop:3965 length:510 start_codon:yes stop_codon:yes gene_type:complete